MGRLQSAWVAGICLAATGATSACGGGSGAGESGAGGAPPELASATGGAGGAPLQAAPGGGGTSGQGGSSSAGGDSASGGAGAASGGTPGAGGVGAGGAVASAGGAGGNGAATCDPAGTWAILFQTSVKWPDNQFVGITVLDAGSGSQTLRLLSKRSYDPATKKVTDTARICSVTLPKFTTIAGDIQLAFPDGDFDGKEVPTTLVSALAEAPKAGVAFESDTNQILVGASGLSATDAWPAATSITSQDADGDGKPGMTAEEDGKGVPVDVSTTVTADRLYVAFRSLAKASGTMASCDRMAGTIDLQSINQSILGCRIKGGTVECNSTQTQFINDNSPKWSPDAASSIVMQRVDDGASCADVRQLKF